MLNYTDLPYKHEDNCNSKESNNTRKENVVFDAELQIEVEYDVYCAECGAYLYHFQYGDCMMY